MPASSFSSIVFCSTKLFKRLEQFQTWCIMADLFTHLSVAPVVINQAFPKHHWDLTANLFHRLLFRARSGEAEEKSSDGESHLAVVACGPRLEETLTMLKSAVLLSNKPLNFHIFAEDDLQQSFRDAVSVLYKSAADLSCLCNVHFELWHLTRRYANENTKTLICVVRI